MANMALQRTRKSRATELFVENITGKSTFKNDLPVDNHMNLKNYLAPTTLLLGAADDSSQPAPKAVG